MFQTKVEEKIKTQI